MNKILNYFLPEFNHLIMINESDTDLFGGGLLVLPEEVVEDGAVLLVDALHLVDVLGHLQRHRI